MVGVDLMKLRQLVDQSRQYLFAKTDFKLDVFASEPMVYDPVEMVFDENGRIFVAEMVDYPEDPPPGKPTRSRIVMLEDSDGGRPDRHGHLNRGDRDLRRPPAPGERPAPTRKLQTCRAGMQVGTPARQPGRRVGLNGVPDETLTIPEYCHPPKSLLASPGDLKSGMSQI